MPDTMTGELYAVVYAMCVKTCHLFAYDGLDCFALPCDVMYKIWSINLYIYIYSLELGPANDPDHWRRNRGGQGGHVPPPPLFRVGGGKDMCVPPHTFRPRI